MRWHFDARRPNPYRAIFLKSCVLPYYGNDTLYGGAGADEIHGGADDDTIVQSDEYGETDVDTLYGDLGNDRIAAANLPASKDVVNCGDGTDEVIADTLDQVAADCEKVEKIQDKEPTLPNGTYGLAPSASSDCEVGDGSSVTISNEPETGERGVELQVTQGQAPTNGDITTCEIKVDYQNVSPPQDGASAQSGGTVAYEGTKVATDPEIVEQASQDVVNDSTDPAPATNEVGAQYAWTRANFKSWVTTRDPLQIRLAETYNRITYYHNGYGTSFSSRNKNFYARSNPVYRPITHWYMDYNSYVGAPWYASANRAASRVASKFHNWDFQNRSLSTRVYHDTTVFAGVRGYGDLGWSSKAYGEYWWALNHRASWCNCF